MGIGRPPSCACGDCQKCRHREYMRKWYAGKPGYGSAQGRKHRDRARDYERDRWHSDPVFRAKKMARIRVKTALERGNLVRLPCEVCGVEPAEAHHPDYNRPLDVMWLCERHHAEWHESNVAIAPIVESEAA